MPQLLSSFVVAHRCWGARWCDTKVTTMLFIVSTVIGRAWVAVFAAIAAILVIASGSFAADLDFNIKIDSLTNHNVSASPHYDQSHFPKNFGTTSKMTPTDVMTIDPARTDRNLHPVTPGHVSGMDVHTLIPSRPDLRWFAHLMCWWGTGSPFDIGVDMDTDEYVKSLVTDLMNRGFNGVIVCIGDTTGRYDSIVKRIQAYAKTLPAGKFTFIILLDEGLVNNKTAPQQVLQDAVEYCKQNYFTDPNYEREDGKPILMYYGVRENLGKSLGEPQAAAAMQAVKSATGDDVVWVTQGKDKIAEAWVDQTYDWHNAWPDEVNPSDPYNLYWVNDYFKHLVQYPQKKAFGAMCAGYNDTLSGRQRTMYLPRGSGACLVERARSIDANIPANVTRMQWVTWNDWMEGTAVEPGIENDVTVAAAVESSTVRWKVTSSAGDESTIDHYEIYASVDGINAAKLGSVPAGTHSFNLVTASGLASGTSYQITVVAVGKPCIRNHAATMVKYTAVAN
jgi:hypothetical protein